MATGFLSRRIYALPYILPTGVVEMVSVDKKDIKISDKLAKELEIIISQFIFPKSDNGAKVNYPINLYPN